MRLTKQKIRLSKSLVCSERKTRSVYPVRQQQHKDIKITIRHRKQQQQHRKSPEHYNNQGFPKRSLPVAGTKRLLRRGT